MNVQLAWLCREGEGSFATFYRDADFKLVCEDSKDAIIDTWRTDLQRQYPKAKFVWGYTDE